MSPVDRVYKLISHYELEVGFDPDVIYMTKDFFDLILKSQALTKFPSLNPNEDPEIFGKKIRIVNHLDGLDFQCFKSDHLNILGDRFKKDPRYADYTLDIFVPRFSLTDVSYIANGCQNPTNNDKADLKKIKIIASNEVLKNWVGQ